MIRLMLMIMLDDNVAKNTKFNTLKTKINSLE